MLLKRNQRSQNRRALVVLSLGLAAFSSGTAFAGQLLLGSNATSPDQVQLLDSTGALLSLIGPNAASAAAFDGLGHTFFAHPGDNASTVEEYDSGLNLIGSWVFIAPSDVRASASYIEDLAYGLGGWLWISTYSGEVYAVNPVSGAVHSSFDTGVTSPGVTVSGGFLYTTEGMGLFQSASHIYQRDSAGNLMNSVDTGLNDTLGLAFDSDTQQFWVGSFDFLSSVNTSGNILNQVANDGVHTGLEAFGVQAIPEPGSILLVGIATALFFGLRTRKVGARLAGLAGCCLAAGSLGAAVTTPTISPSLASPRSLGTTITFTTSASDTDAGNIRFRFRTRPSGGTFTIVRDFAPNTTLAWTPNDTDGLFEIEVTAENTSTLSTATNSLIYQVTPLATVAPLVNPTSHPLVALYSAPPCAAGSSMRVRFKLVADVAWQSTNLKPCGATSMNFYVAGMRASSTYQLRHDVIHGASITTGPTLTFTTGAVAVTLPVVTQPVPLHAPTSTTEGVTLFGILSLLSPRPQFAVDSTGNVIWYSTISTIYPTRPANGGTFFNLFGYSTDLKNSGFRETDLVGNLVRETNVERLNAELALMSMNPITAIHHEVRRLPNGNLLALAMTERRCIAGLTEGSPSHVCTAQGDNDIAGDMILVMDSNMQILWAWDSFDHLDVNRPAVLGETCGNGSGLCVLFKLTPPKTQANDWTHGNAVALTPDGNFLYSARHQDLFYKISYQNGTGDGHVIWKNGKDGDFTWISADAYPWQSHQHDVSYAAAGIVSLFDNGNTRKLQFPSANSRGQVLSVNETNMTVTPNINADLGAYSAALGSAQKLSNGNYEFGNGIIAGPGTDAVEVTPGGAITSKLHAAASDYRVFRLRDLYSAP
jgi:hypothetical protein